MTTDSLKRLQRTWVAGAFLVAWMGCDVRHLIGVVDGGTGGNVDPGTGGAAGPGTGGASSTGTGGTGGIATAGTGGSGGANPGPGGAGVVACGDATPPAAEPLPAPPPRIASRL